MVLFFVCFVPVGLLRPNMAVFVPCDCKLPRAYSQPPRVFVCPFLGQGPISITRANAQIDIGKYDTTFYPLID